VLDFAEFMELVVADDTCFKFHMAPEVPPADHCTLHSRAQHGMTAYLNSKLGAKLSASGVFDGRRWTR